MSKRKYTDQQLAQVLALAEEGKKFSTIAATVGLSLGSISYLCLKHGAISARSKIRPDINLRPYIRNGFPVRPFTAAEDKMLLELEAAGTGIFAIAKALGRQHNSCSGRLMTLARRDAILEEAA